MALNAQMNDHYGVEDTLDERQWSKLAPLLGQPYNVWGQNDLRCTQSPGLLSTTIAAGRAACFGFGADFNQQTIAHPTITSGSRWDLIALRFDWTPDETGGGGNAYPVIIPGTATKALPAGRQTNAGVTYDMPLALAYIVYDATDRVGHIQAYEDLRRFPSPIFSRSTYTVPPEQLIDGLQVSYGGTTYYYRADTKRWVAPRVNVLTDTITPYTAAQVAKNPASGWLLSDITVPDPGFPYSIIATGQFELDPVTRTKVWVQYGTTPTLNTQALSPQFFAVRGTAETKTLTANFIHGRTGPTNVRLLAGIHSTDVKTGATFSTTQYNGLFKVMVVPL